MSTLVDTPTQQAQKWCVLRALERVFLAFTGPSHARCRLARSLPRRCEQKRRFVECWQCCRAMLLHRRSTKQHRQEGHCKNRSRSLKKKSTFQSDNLVVARQNYNELVSKRSSDLTKLQSAVQSRQTEDVSGRDNLQIFSGQ